MKRRRWPWILLGLVCLLGAAIATLPAELAWRWLLSGQLKGVELNGLSGSVWNGSATEVRIRGLGIGSLQWQLDPLALARMKPRLNVQLAGSGLQARMGLERLASGALLLREAEATVDGGWLGPVLALPGLVPLGQVQLKVPQLQVDPDGVPASGEVQLDWRDAALTGLAQANLGQINISAQGSGRRWLGTVRNAPGGALSMEGGFSLVERNYSAEIRLRSLIAEDPVTRLLPMIGQTQADGSQLLRIEGFLLPLNP